MIASDDDNFLDGLLIGAVVGTLVGGALGLMLAPRRRRPAEPSRPPVAENGSTGLEEPHRRTIENARLVLEEKIAQLNRAIDETRSRLGTTPSSLSPPPEALQ